MENKLKGLPKGVQAFDKLRKRDYLYVDKTEDILNLVNDGDSFFLSRPRRFGKSLLISTLEELFKGNKELFKGLYIYDKWDWNESYPVINIDMSGINKFDSIQNFLEGILQKLSAKFKVKLEIEPLNLKFGELIEKIYESTGKELVVLIDEYDSPIVNNLSDIETVETARNVLNSFYSALKENERYIKFIFLTGVTKFSKISVFSALNNITDISLHRDYVSICGYTQKELEHYFKDYIEKLANDKGYSYEETLEKIKYWYDGYSWDGKNYVYNPYSTILLFTFLRFKPHWYETGTPTFLSDFSQSIEDIVDVLEPTETFESDFDNIDPLDISQTALLFQAGYLTVTNIDEDQENAVFTLDIPNFEVRTALLNNLVKTFSNKPIKKLIKHRKEFWKGINTTDAELIKKVVGDYLSPIPNLIRGTDEKYYHALIFRWLLTMGFKIHSEQMTYKGRMDAIIEEEDKIVIIEFKQDNELTIDKLIQEAFKQIEEKEYSRPYKGREIIKMALVFSKGEIGCEFKKNY